MILWDKDESGGRRGDTLTIGLINNMPDAALEATERQFASLIEAAAGPKPVHIRLFALPGVPRGGAGRERIERLYFDIRALWSANLDALIVTGAEPCAADLRDEPYWPALIDLAAWAEENVASVLWSCLAAHAAALHLSGIRRVRMAEKCSGVFSCAVSDAHSLTEGMPPRFAMPHSRYNELPEDELRKAGYSILTRSSQIGADMFAKPGKSLFLFVQGHPEYESDTLLREYRRDVRRYLRHERTEYPAMPRNYFEACAAAEYAKFRERAMSDPDDRELEYRFAKLPEPLLRNTWRTAAVKLYRNWLSLLAARRESTGTPLSREIGHEHSRYL